MAVAKVMKKDTDKASRGGSVCVCVCVCVCVRGMALARFLCGLSWLVAGAAAPPQGQSELLAGTCGGTRWLHSPCASVAPWLPPAAAEYVHQKAVEVSGCKRRALPFPLPPPLHGAPLYPPFIGPPFRRRRCSARSVPFTPAAPL